jgi:guanine nucleotide-binding protein G(I)/G(S)/G(T) subunit beta-1
MTYLTLFHPILSKKIDAKIHAIPLRSSWVMTCAYEQMNDQFVACGGLDNLCSIYKLNHEGEPINRTHRELAGHDGYLSSCRFIGPEKILTASGDSSCILWDIETGSALLKFEGHEQDVMALHVQAHVNPYTFVSGSCDCSAKVWDTRSGRCTMTLQGHSNDINAVSLFQDCHTFASGGDDSTIRVFDLRSVAEVKCFSSESILCGVTSLDVSKSGRFVFGGYDDYNCYKWDVLGSGQKVAQVMSGHENRVSCVAVNPLGNAVCTGSWDASLKIWA